MSSASSKRDSLGTRSRILTAAWDLLTGNADPAMGEIAARAGLSRQAVYLHFENRLDLLMAVADWANEQAGLPARVAWANRATSPPEMLRRMVKVTVWLVERTRPGILALHRAVEADPATAEAWPARQGRATQAGKVVSALHAGGLLRRDLTIAEATALLTALTRPIVIADLLAAGLSATKATAALHRTTAAALCREA